MSSCNLAAGKEPMLPATQQVVSSGDQAIKAGMPCMDALHVGCTLDEHWMRGHLEFPLGILSLPPF